MNRLVREVRLSVRVLRGLLVVAAVVRCRGKQGKEQVVGLRKSWLVKGKLNEVRVVEEMIKRVCKRGNDCYLGY